MVTVCNVYGVTKGEVHTIPLKEEPKTVDEREEIMSKLTDLGISFKKTMKTETLKSLLPSE